MSFQRISIWTVVGLCLAAGPGLGQSSAPAASSDLARAAEVARAERERQEARRSSNSDAVSQMAKELSEEKEDDQSGAPPGYRYFSFTDGDYRILVPARAQPEARDSYGFKLLSSDPTNPGIAVVLGDPIEAQGYSPQEMLRNAAATYLEGCRVAVSPYLTVSGRPAASVSFSNCPLNHEILGRAQLVLRDGYVLPMICGYEFQPGDLTNGYTLYNPEQMKGIQRAYQRETNGYQVCNTVLPSLRFGAHPGNWKPKSAVRTPEHAVVTKALETRNAPAVTVAEGGESLGQFARDHRRTASGEVVEELRHTAPGFSVYSFRYCQKEECYDASLLVPVKGREDMQYKRMDAPGYSQYRMDIGLFQFEVPVAGSVATIEARTGAPTAPGFLTREEFINTKTDWWIENTPAGYYRAPGPVEVFSEELTTLSDMPARLARFRGPAGINMMITEQAAYMAPGRFVQVRCTAPEKIFADASDMCAKVVRSLDVPAAHEAQDPPEDEDP
jgi:hypothetical protein